MVYADAGVYAGRAPALHWWQCTGSELCAGLAPARWRHSWVCNFHSAQTEIISSFCTLHYHHLTHQVAPWVIAGHVILTRTWQLCFYYSLLNAKYLSYKSSWWRETTGKSHVHTSFVIMSQNVVGFTVLKCHHYTSPNLCISTIACMRLILK